MKLQRVWIDDRIDEKMTVTKYRRLSTQFWLKYMFYHWYLALFIHKHSKFSLSLSISLYIYIYIYIHIACTILCWFICLVIVNANVLQSMNSVKDISLSTEWPHRRVFVYVYIVRFFPNKFQSCIRIALSVLEIFQMTHFFRISWPKERGQPVRIKLTNNDLQT